jgi:hypothetical protein
VSAITPKNAARLLRRADALPVGSVLDLGDRLIGWHRESEGWVLDSHVRVYAPTLIEHLSVLAACQAAYHVEGAIRSDRQHALLVDDAAAALLPRERWEHLRFVDAELAFTRGEWVLRGVNPRTAPKRRLVVAREKASRGAYPKPFRATTGPRIGTVGYGTDFRDAETYQSTYLSVLREDTT